MTIYHKEIGLMILTQILWDLFILRTLVCSLMLKVTLIKNKWCRCSPCFKNFKKQMRMEKKLMLILYWQTASWRTSAMLISSHKMDKILTEILKEDLYQEWIPFLMELQIITPQTQIVTEDNHQELNKWIKWITQSIKRLTLGSLIDLD